MRFFRAIVASWLTALGLVAAMAVPAGAIQAVEYRDGITHGGVGRIAAGPDGNLWFTEAGDTIGRISTAGTVAELTGFPSPGDIASGPDGRIWFTSDTVGGSALGWVTTDGASRGTYSTHAEITGGNLVRLTAGPDGALWFTRAGGSAYTVARMTTGGALTNFAPSYSPGTLPSGIAVGPDGALWYAETGEELAPERPSPSFRGIVRITTTGQITPFRLRVGPHTRLFPHDIVAGPDRALWFTLEPSMIGRMTTTGHYTLFDARPPRNGSVGSIAAGPDGNLWYSVTGGRIGRMTRKGLVTVFRTPSRSAGVGDLAVGSDGNLWMTDPTGGIVKVVPPRGRCVVPRLLGLRFASAKRRLHRAHCTVGAVAAPRRTHRDTLFVQHQFPRRGARLPAESAVDLMLRR